MTNQILKTGLGLVLFTIVCIGLVQLIQQQTKDIIAKNIAQVRLDKLMELVPNYDNDILTDSITKSISLYNSNQVITIYLAKQQSKTIAYLIEHTYPLGYSGDIVLLTAIKPDGELIGVRVINHRETPGLGDGIDKNKSSWILQFQAFLHQQKVWQVKQAGGDFDALSGATISSEAVIRAVDKVLLNFKALLVH